MPDEFIPLAEHTGLIRELTAYVLDRSLQQCREWHDEGLRLGGRGQRQPPRPARLPLPGRGRGAARSATTSSPPMLELEITENTAITDLPRARAVLSQLSQLGVQLAVDDFGAGNASLAYLRRLPVDRAEDRPLAGLADALPARRRGDRRLDRSGSPTRSASR